jgi:hypothetical protein
MPRAWGAFGGALGRFGGRFGEIRGAPWGRFGAGSGALFHRFSDQRNSQLPPRPIFAAPTPLQNNFFLASQTTNAIEIPQSPDLSEPSGCTSGASPRATSLNRQNRAEHQHPHHRPLQFPPTERCEPTTPSRRFCASLLLNTPPPPLIGRPFQTSALTLQRNRPHADAPMCTTATHTFPIAQTTRTIVLSVMDRRASACVGLHAFP